MKDWHQFCVDVGIQPQPFEEVAFRTLTKAINLEANPPSPEALARLPAATARRFNILPVACQKDRHGRDVLVVAVCNADMSGIDAAKDANPDWIILPVRAPADQLRRAIDQAYRG